jgi:hypothetical protein
MILRAPWQTRVMMVKVEELQESLDERLTELEQVNTTTSDQESRALPRPNPCCGRTPYLPVTSRQRGPYLTCVAYIHRTLAFIQEADLTRCCILRPSA